MNEVRTKDDKDDVFAKMRRLQGTGTGNRYMRIFSPSQRAHQFCLSYGIRQITARLFSSPHPCEFRNLHPTASTIHDSYLLIQNQGLSKPLNSEEVVKKVRPQSGLGHPGVLEHSKA